MYQRLLSRRDPHLSRPDEILDRARRAALHLAFGGGIALLAVGVVQVGLNDPNGWLVLLAAVPTSTMGALLLRMERPPVVLLLGGVALLTLGVETIGATLGRVGFVRGAGAEIVVLGVGILGVFVARRDHWMSAVFFNVVAVATLIVSGLGVGGSAIEVVADVVLAVAVMSTLMLLVVLVQRWLTTSRRRYVELANAIPVLTMELDISVMMERLDRLRSAGVTELGGTVAGDTALLDKLISSMRLSYANRQAIAMVGSIGTWPDLVRGPNRARMIDALRDVITSLWSGDDAGRGEVAIVGRDGVAFDLIYEWGLGSVEGKRDRTRLLLTCTDVTRLRQTEQALADQLKERDQFVASVSHELRTPLTAVMGFTTELVDRPDDFDEGERAELLEMILDQVQDVSSIVEDLLVTARAESGQVTVSMEPVDVSAEASRVVESLGGIPVDGPVAMVDADPARLRQIIRNLVTNAHRYGGPNPRIVVVAGPDGVVLEVRDDGAALSADERRRIFEAYERSSGGGPVGSVGLGLHVARLLARLMQGDLTYDHDGNESIFRLELRAARAEAA